MQLCLCSICRKVGGVGGSINLGGHSKTLKVEGKENLSCVQSLKSPFDFTSNSYRSVYKAVIDRDTPKEHIASSERNFCKKCSSMLWLYDETWCACSQVDVMVDSGAYQPV